MALLFFCCCVQERDKEAREQPERGYPRCHFFSSFFLNKLYRDSGVYNYKNVVRWTTPKKLQTAGQVRHWPLARGSMKLNLRCVGNKLSCSNVRPVYPVHSIRMSYGKLFAWQLDVFLLLC